MQVFVPLDWRSKLAAALFLTHSAVVDLNKNLCEKSKPHTTEVSVQGVESLWGDCRFIPADWGS